MDEGSQGFCQSAYQSEYGDQRSSTAWRSLANRLAEDVSRDVIPWV
jgi:hypothetical protein